MNVILSTFLFLIQQLFAAQTADAYKIIYQIH